MRRRAAIDFLLAVVLLQSGILLGQLLPVTSATAAGPRRPDAVPNTPVTLTGQLTSSNLTTLYTVPEDRVLVITDISVSGLMVNTGDLFRLFDATRNSYLWSGAWNTVTTLSYNAGYQPMTAEAHFTSGLTLPAKTELQASSYYGTYGSTKVTNIYTITGYLMKP